jgi:cytochrome c553
MLKFLTSLLILVSLVVNVAADSKAEFFESKIRPLLIERCESCHNRDAKGGLRLDSRRGLSRGGRSGTIVVAGKPEKSLLYLVVSGKHEKLKMPPDDPLERHEVDALKQWIRDGAFWPESTGSSSDRQYGITEADRSFWSFQPVVRPGVPSVNGESWSGNPIDAFILSRLEEEGLRQGDGASRRTLIRRATYNLLGLPPSSADIDNYVGDDSPDAWQNLINRLLASRHYGERWGRHWLDVVRYADTAGDAADFPVPEAYKYRNYVIDAFNKDKPYHQFVREQIAGDLLDAGSDEEKWEQTIGTGYVAISRRIGVSPHGLRHITIEDTLDNLGKTFLGLTIGCARCHDHKFDPIPTDDYYALYGIFDSSVYPHAGAEHKPWRQDFAYRIGKEESDKLLKPYRDELETWNRKERVKLEEYRDFQRKPIADVTKTREKAWQAVLAMREARRPFAEAFPNLEVAYALQEGEAHDVEIQQGGDPRSRGQSVRRGFLRILGGQKLSDSASGSGRRELANWLTDSANPLTARVIVNRIWHWHFGRGLVATTSDFGIRGTPPTHPELLDFLASWFVENGWSIKKLHRLIMTSQTYQLASSDVPSNSKADPENLLLWRANRQRLDAEQIRDSILTFSGDLDLTPGGRHPFDHRLTYFFRQHEPFVGDFPTNRRSVYMMQQRIRKDDYLDLFDGPDGNIPASQRRSTTTTLQALFLMNSDFLHEQAELTAKRIVSTSDFDAERLGRAYRTIFGRSPENSELDYGSAYLQKLRDQLSGDLEVRQTNRAWASLLRSMMSSNEFVFVD